MFAWTDNVMLYCIDCVKANQCMNLLFSSIRRQQVKVYVVNSVQTVLNKAVLLVAMIVYGSVSTQFGESGSGSRSRK